MSPTLLSLRLELIFISLTYIFCSTDPLFSLASQGTLAHFLYPFSCLPHFLICLVLLHLPDSELFVPSTDKTEDYTSLPNPEAILVKAWNWLWELS